MQNICWKKFKKKKKGGRGTKNLKTLDCWFKIIWASQTAELIAFPLCPWLIWRFELFFFFFFFFFLCNVTNLCCSKVFRPLLRWAKTCHQFPFYCGEMLLTVLIIEKPQSRWRRRNRPGQFNVSISHWLERWSLFSQLCSVPLKIYATNLALLVHPLESEGGKLLKK